MKISHRLETLLETHRRSASELARYCDVSPQAVGHWMRGTTEPRGPKIAAIAAFFGISVSELLFPADAGASGGGVQSNIIGMTGADKVPLISFVQAGAWCEASDPYNVGDAESWLPCPVKHGSKTYALRVRGESMFAPSSQPSFSDGDIIFCDPSLEVRHRSLVVVRLTGSNEATFKRVLIDGTRRFLEALNPSWPNRIFELEEDSMVCGVVIARLESFI